MLFPDYKKYCGFKVQTRSNLLSETTLRDKNRSILSTKYSSYKKDEKKHIIIIKLILLLLRSEFKTIYKW